MVGLVEFGEAASQGLPKNLKDGMKWKQKQTALT